MLFLEENMTGERIDQLLTSNKDTFPLFLGVYSADTLPRVVLKRPSFLVTNDEPSYKEGNHWVGIFLPRMESCFYFDSFGNPPSHPNIISFLTRNSSRNYDYNRKAFQMESSSTCGSFVIAAAIMFSKGGGIETICSLFKPFHERENEKRVKEIVEEGMRKV